MGDRRQQPDVGGVDQPEHDPDDHRSNDHRQDQGRPDASDETALPGNQERQREAQDRLDRHDEEDEPGRREQGVDERRVSERPRVVVQPDGSHQASKTEEPGAGPQSVDEWVDDDAEHEEQGRPEHEVRERPVQAGAPEGPAHGARRHHGCHGSVVALLGQVVLDLLGRSVHGGPSTASRG